MVRDGSGHGPPPPTTMSLAWPWAMIGYRLGARRVTPGVEERPTSSSLQAESWPTSRAPMATGYLEPPPTRSDPSSPSCPASAGPSTWPRSWPSLAPSGIAPPTSSQPRPRAAPPPSPGPPARRGPSASAGPPTPTPARPCRPSPTTPATPRPGPAGTPTLQLGLPPCCQCPCRSLGIDLGTSVGADGAPNLGRVTMVPEPRITPVLKRKESRHRPFLLRLGKPIRGPFRLPLLESRRFSSARSRLRKASWALRVLLPPSQLWVLPLHLVPDPVQVNGRVPLLLCRGALPALI
jgi:hypothetical protein